MYVCSSVTVCVLLLLISIKVTRDVYLYVGITFVVIKTEADDVTKCQRNDKPSTGMFAVSVALLSAFICVCNFMYC